ncbi:MAG: hypothetical protein ABIB71_06870 [Candidatus Woesearchaeota archaeon]
MLGKKVGQSSQVIRQLIQEGKIVKPKAGTDGFFLKKSREALNVSQRLFGLQEEESLETSLWVINTAYYSMFFAATALQAYFNHKIKVKQGIHSLTYHALVHYFIKEDNKLKKHIMENYKEAVEEAEDLLQLCENKIDGMVRNFSFELSKRKEFTYDIGKIAEKSKAETSLSRAKEFFVEIESIMP